ncbi:hypothetical protein ACPEEZ_13855 [Frigoribacterium sp. 2-23]|uniref:hypothetical protein n=1 Tax=Frigoribacterium sp. 2-23 TaxID=3415006 RepID=UPI003C6EE8DD
MLRHDPRHGQGTRRRIRARLGPAARASAARASAACASAARASAARASAVSASAVCASASVSIAIAGVVPVVELRREPVARVGLGVVVVRPTIVAHGFNPRSSSEIAA